jgi:Xaa-Pro aminopeptidase
MSAIVEKISRVQQYLETEGLSGLLLTSRRNFAWLTSGGTNHVRLGSEFGIASLLILKDGRRFIIAGNNEMPRLQDEEVGGMGFEPVEFDWSNPDRKIELIGQIAAGGILGSDSAFPNAKLTEDSFARVRYSLTDEEIARYREVGAGCAQAVEEVCRNLQPGRIELAIEAMVSEALLRRGLRPTVLLVGVDERIRKYRHPVPTEKRLERYAMIAVNAQRWGLVASLTRSVHFGPPAEELETRHRAVCGVHARFRANTKQGVQASEIFTSMKEWYGQAGYPEQWRYHHQGGAIGYREREWVLTPGLNETIHDRQAFAWNPTIEGTKAEETILVLDGSTESLTSTGKWPTLEVTVDGQTFPQPAILIR